MSDAMLDCFVRDYLQSQPDGEVQFSWQGGEPALAGRDFYLRAMALQQRYRRAGQRVSNVLQSNGTLLDDAWCAFLQQYGFVVGLSVDGPSAVHDLSRVDRKGRPTLQAVQATARRLHAYAVPFSTLTVVGQHNAHAARQVYRFLVDDLGSRVIQLIACVEPRDFARVAPGTRDPASLPQVDDARALAAFVTPQSVSPAQWGRFLCDFFDVWRSNGLGRVQVNLFETAVLQLLGYPALQCTSADACGQAVALERDGSVYACDHFVYPQYRLGRLGETPLASLLDAPGQQAFGAGKRDALPQACRSCGYLPLCWGECPRNRFVRTASGEAGLSYLCRGQQQFFRHALGHLQAIAAVVGRAASG
jgi:uncharacterized protein